MKPTLLKLTAVLLILAGVFTSCQETPNPIDPDKPPVTKYPIDISFTEYSLALEYECLWNDSNFNYDNAIIIINSDEEMDEYFSCHYNKIHNPIDFSKYTLLLTSWQTREHVLKNSKKLQQLSHYQYQLNIELFVDEHLIHEKWIGALLVEKLSKESTIELKTTLVKPKFILPVSVTEQNIIDFFNMVFPIKSGHLFDKSPCFFTTLPSNKDTCLIINSMNEFRSACECSNDLPEIDFDNYTLIIGKKHLANLSVHISEQKIIEDNVLTLYLCIFIPDSGFTAMHQAYHWGLYPKLSNKSFFVEYTYF